MFDTQKVSQYFLVPKFRTPTWSRCIIPVISTSHFRLKQLLMWPQLSPERQRERETDWTLPIQWVSLSQNPPVVIEGQVGALSAQTDLEGSWLNSHFLSVFPSQRCGQQEYILHGTSFCSATLSTLNVLFVPPLHTFTHIHTQRRGTEELRLLKSKWNRTMTMFSTECKLAYCLLKCMQNIAVCNDFKQKQFSHDLSR